MEVYFHGEGHQFDPKIFKNFTDCFAKGDDQILLKAQNDAWTGFVKYYESNGADKDYQNRSDHWGNCTFDQPNPRCTAEHYRENKTGSFGPEKVLVYEPCNYASNIAYYHSALRACDYNWTIDATHAQAMKRGFATLGAGSAFWHGSHTFVGYSFDNQMISVISYLSHQVIVSSLPDSPILRGLSNKTRNLTSVDVSEQLTLMFSNQPTV